MNPSADLHRARRAIAQSDATLPQRLEAIRAHAEKVSLTLTPLLLACSDLLALARAERAKGVELLPEHSALALFDLVTTLSDDADRAWRAADLALISLRYVPAHRATYRRAA